MVVRRVITRLVVVTVVVPQDTLGNSPILATLTRVSSVRVVLQSDPVIEVAVDALYFKVSISVNNFFISLGCLRCWLLSWLNRRDRLRLNLNLLDIDSDFLYIH